MKPAAKRPVGPQRITRSIAFEKPLLAAGILEAQKRRQSFSAYLCSLIADAVRPGGSTNELRGR